MILELQFNTFFFFFVVGWLCGVDSNFATGQTQVTVVPATAAQTALYPGVDKSLEERCIIHTHIRSF